MKQRLVSNGFRTSKKINGKTYYSSMSLNHNTQVIIVDDETDKIMTYFMKNTIIRSELDIEKLGQDFIELKEFVESLEDNDYESEGNY